MTSKAPFVINFSRLESFIIRLLASIYLRDRDEVVKLDVILCWD
jgi:hypothetical protein